MNKYLRNFLLNSRIPLLAEWGARDLKRKHLKRHGAHQREVFAKLYGAEDKIAVLNGPFKGMRYINEGVWGSITPKWIGSYEHELWPAVAEILGRAYKRVIDVGSADGYYAVGFARALPGAEISAYDIDPVSRQQVFRNWELNDRPGSLRLERWCDHAALERMAGRGSLVFCDIEGGEMVLLDPVKCPVLARTDILVEVHETGKRGVEANADALAARFAQTHELNRIVHTGEVPALAGVDALDRAALAKACDEGRPYRQIWLWLRTAG